MPTKPKITDCNAPKRVITGSSATVRHFPIFPYLYLIVPWSQFWQTAMVRPDLQHCLIGLEWSAS